MPNLWKWLAVLCLPILCMGCDVKTSPGPIAPTVSSVISVTTRKSFLDSSSGVLQLTNTSQKPIGKITVWFRNKDTKTEATVVIGAIDPGKTAEIGMLEGWALEPNESVVLYLDGYTKSSYSTYQGANGNVGIR